VITSSARPGLSPTPLPRAITPPEAGPGTALRLPVLSSFSAGVTELSAFHRALMRVGIGYANLIRLSSVIPPGAVVRPDRRVPPGGTWGDRLYCVYAEQRTSTPGEEAWAAVGWVQRLDGGGGLLVEHEGGSEGYVTEAVRLSLADMVAEADEAFGEPQWVTCGGRCEDQPVAALVVVPFVRVPW
jgi:arginine decarboxylase